MKKNLLLTALTLIGFMLSYYLDKILYSFDHNWATWLPDNAFLWYLTWFLARLSPVILVTLIIAKGEMLRELGLSKSFIKATGFAILFTAPLFIGFALLSPLNSDFKLLKIWTNCIQPGFYEEVLMRSFLFGLLFRRFKWGFLPATLFCAIFFGMWHLYQGSNWLSSFYAFVATAFGSIWFSWLYAEWRFNAWINIGLHVLMNFSWLLFSVEGGAAGNMTANILRAITVAASIIVTIRLISKKEGYVVNRTNLWINKG